MEKVNLQEKEGEGGKPNCARLCQGEQQQGREQLEVLGRERRRRACRETKPETNLLETEQGLGSPRGNSPGGLSPWEGILCCRLRRGRAAAGAAAEVALAAGAELRSLQIGFFGSARGSLP